MSGQVRYEEVVDRTPVAHTLALFLAAAAIFAGIVSLFYYPMRTGTSAIFVSLVAAGIGHRNQRFLGLAVAVASLGWLGGMLVCIFLDRPIL